MKKLVIMITDILMLISITLLFVLLVKRNEDFNSLEDKYEVLVSEKAFVDAKMGVLVSEKAFVDAKMGVLSKDVDLWRNLYGELRINCDDLKSEIQNKINECYRELNADNRSCEIYDGLRYKNHPRIDGIYWYGEDYYCVWANSKSYEEVELTDRHEYAHFLVDNNYNHFCEW